MMSAEQTRYLAEDALALALRTERRPDGSIGSVAAILANLFKAGWVLMPEDQTNDGLRRRIDSLERNVADHEQTLGRLGAAFQDHS